MVVFAPDHKSSCLAISQNRSREGHPPMMMFHCTEIITLYLLPPCLHCFANCSNRFFRSLIFRHTAKILFCNLFFFFLALLRRWTVEVDFFPIRIRVRQVFRLIAFYQTSQFFTAEFSKALFRSSMRTFSNLLFSHNNLQLCIYICCCSLDDEWASHLIL